VAAVSPPFDRTRVDTISDRSERRLGLGSGIASIHLADLGYLHPDRLAAPVHPKIALDLEALGGDAYNHKKSGQVAIASEILPLRRCRKAGDILIGQRKAELTHFRT
jgi:hypothetical protein